MRDEQLAARLEMPFEHADHPLLDRPVEVDHDVAAEDDVEALRSRSPISSRLSRANVTAACRRGCTRASPACAPMPFSKCRLQHLARQAVDPLHLVDAAAGRSSAPWSTGRRRGCAPAPLRRRRARRPSSSRSCTALRRSSTRRSRRQGRRRPTSGAIVEAQQLEVLRLAEERRVIGRDRVEQRHQLVARRSASTNVT